MPARWTPLPRRSRRRRWGRCWGGCSGACATRRAPWQGGDLGGSTPTGKGFRDSCGAATILPRAVWLSRMYRALLVTGMVLTQQHTVGVRQHIMRGALCWLCLPYCSTLLTTPSPHPPHPLSPPPQPTHPPRLLALPVFAGTACRLLAEYAAWFGRPGQGPQLQVGGGAALAGYGALRTD